MAADPRQFTEHNTMGNVSVYLEDKRMEELKSATAKTSSQISTSAQYIPLQDTDGNLVKINPASFEEAVRNVLGSLLANNDKGTTISGLPALSGSGANLDFGSVTPANLASVLGVKILCKYAGYISDVDDFEVGTVYVLTSGSTPSHRPSGQRLFIATLCPEGLEDKYGKFQVGISATGYVYVRSYNGDETWGEWIEKQ